MIVLLELLIDPALRISYQYGENIWFVSSLSPFIEADGECGYELTGCIEKGQNLS